MSAAEEEMVSGYIVESSTQCRETRPEQPMLIDMLSNGAIGVAISAGSLPQAFTKYRAWKKMVAFEHIREQRRSQGVNLLVHIARPLHRAGDDVVSSGFQ